MKSIPAGKMQSRRKRYLVCFFLFVLGLYAFLCSMLAWETVCPKRHLLTTTPAMYKLPFESIAFPSVDGTRLAGWFVPTKSRPRGVIVLCHGVDSTRTAMLAKAEVLQHHGYALLLFDFRARGESGGAHSTLGFRETDDLIAAVGYLRSRSELRGVPVGVYGESMGAAVALMGTARCPLIAAVVGESPFASLDHAIDNHFRKVLGWGAPCLEIPVRMIGEWLIGKSCADIAPEQEIAQIAPRPLLLIQDGADRLCPSAETRMLMAHAREPKSLWTVPGADHILAQPSHAMEWEQRVTTFFDKNLK